MVIGSQLDLRLVRNGVIYSIPFEYWEFNVRTIVCFNLKHPMIVVGGVLQDRSGSALFGCSDRKEITCARSIKSLRENCFRHAASLQRIGLNEGLTRICKNALAV